MTSLLSLEDGYFYIGSNKQHLNSSGMEKQATVASIMTKDVITVQINESLYNANNIFNSKNLRHLPVVANDELIGILSQTDILRISFGNAFEEQNGDDEAIFDMLSINQVMKHSPITIAPDETIKDAAKTLASKEFHALPVVEDEKLVGMITTTDILNYFIEQH